MIKISDKKITIDREDFMLKMFHFGYIKFSVDERRLEGIQRSTIFWIKLFMLQLQPKEMSLSVMSVQVIQDGDICIALNQSLYH